MLPQGANEAFVQAPLVPHKIPPNLKTAAPHKVPPVPPKAEVVDCEESKAPAPEATEPAKPKGPKAKGPPECLRYQWQEFHQQQQQPATPEAAAQGAVVAVEPAAAGAEPELATPDEYQGDPQERRQIIPRPQGFYSLEEFCVCIDFHNVLDLGSGGRFIAVDQRIVAKLRELLVDCAPNSCAPVRLHICSFCGQAQADYYWSTNLQACQDQLREVLSSPTIRVTAQQVFNRTGIDGKVHRLSLLTPNKPHVFIDDNPSICKEARRTNALVVEVNKRCRVVGLVEDLRQG